MSVVMRRSWRARGVVLGCVVLAWGCDPARAQRQIIKEDLARFALHTIAAPDAQPVSPQTPRLVITPRALAWAPDAASARDPSKLVWIAPADEGGVAASARDAKTGAIKALAERFGAAAPKQVAVRVDANAPYATLAHTLAALRAQGVAEAALVTGDGQAIVSTFGAWCAAPAREAVAGELDCELCGALGGVVDDAPEACAWPIVVVGSKGEARVSLFRQEAPEQPQCALTTLEPQTDARLASLAGMLGAPAGAPEVGEVAPVDGDWSGRVVSAGACPLASADAIGALLVQVSARTPLCSGAQVHGVKGATWAQVLDARAALVAKAGTSRVLWGQTRDAAPPCEGAASASSL